MEHVVALGQGGDAGRCERVLHALLERNERLKPFIVTAVFVGGEDVPACSEVEGHLLSRRVVLDEAEVVADDLCLHAFAWHVGSLEHAVAGTRHRALALLFRPSCHARFLGECHALWCDT